MTFAALLDRFAGQRALVVGDLMLDEYIFGSATRISPEAPVMVIRHRETRRVPGGAANVARNLAALGAEVTLVGTVGDDEAGAMLAGLLEAEHGVRAILIPHAKPTTRKTRIVAEHSHQVLRIDAEDDAPVSAACEMQVADSVRQVLSGADVLVLSDYRKGTLTAGLCRTLIDTAQAQGVATVANPKPATLAQYAGADVVSLNRSEASDAIGMSRLLANDEAGNVASELSKRLGSAVLVTLGDGGIAAAAPHIMHVGAPRVEVADVAGAGDTVVASAALSASLGHGLDERDLRLAAHLAAAVVGHVGVAVPSEADLVRVRSLSVEA